MPKLPTDMAAAKAHAQKGKDALAAKAEKRRQEDANDAAIIRQFANELRARQGLQPLRPDEPVNAIICRRGRRA